MLMVRDKSIAVLVPCKNEAVTIRSVVDSFKSALPGCTVHVYDNNSTDGTAEIARAAGAVVGRESRPGKGNVVRRMFSEVDADIYIMVDGDDTYDAAAAPALVEKLLAEEADMVVAARIGATEKHQRKGHAFGNRVFNVIYSSLFGREFSDIFSGYRVFSRRFVKSFPAVSAGFEIETELSVHASQLRLPVCEVALPYKDRPEGSTSKLSTFRDGARILKTIIVLLKEYKPLYFFGGIGLAGILLAIGLAVPIFIEFSRTGLVERLPTAVLCTGITIVSMLAITAGVVLDSIRRMRAEIKRMFYNLT
ncbi:MAG: glycosyltransferase family 2 protein [Nitratireductor sp.]|nr:glycosyltransferase family 2 protein [Nitratireductor sp.]